MTLAPNYPLLAKYQPDIAQLGWESGNTQSGLGQYARLGLVRVACNTLIANAGLELSVIRWEGNKLRLQPPLFDDRLKVVVSSCGLDSYLDYYQGNRKPTGIHKKDGVKLGTC